MVARSIPAFLMSFLSGERGPHRHTPVNMLRRTGQGAGAGFLLLSGANSFGEGRFLDAVSNTDFTSFDGFSGALLNGSFNGPLALGAALFVFLTAGKCIARLVGLGAVLFLFYMHSRGVSIGDAGDFLGQIAARMSAAAEAFMNPALVDPV